MKYLENCRLCESKRLMLVQKIDRKELVDLYLEKFDIDISKEFTEEVVEYIKCQNCGLYFFAPRIFGSAWFYEQLQIKRNVYYNSGRKEFEYARKFIQKNDKVLEIGSGYCFFADLIKVNDYTGLEFNDKAIKEGVLKGYRMLKQDITDFEPQSNKDFEVVCSFHVLEHVPDIKAFIRSSINVLKDNGKLIIAVPCNDSILTNNMNHVLNMPPHHLNRFRIKTMKKIAEIYNLELLDYHISFVNTSSTKKRYFIEYWSHKIYNFFGKEIIPIGNERYLRIIKKIILKVLTLFKINENAFKHEPIGENMSFIFKKNR